MIELAVIVYMFVAFFAYIGWMRGWTKELISLSGITLALFGLHQFDTLIRITLFGDLPQGSVYYIQAVLFMVIVFFAYQTRALGEAPKTASAGGRSRSSADERDESQTRTLGGLVGALNGYLVSGTLWYLLDIANYPLSPNVTRPLAGTISSDMIANLPLYILGAGEGNLLALMVVILFVVVLIII